MYTYKNGKWRFLRQDGDVFESDTVAIMFDQDDPFDVLLKHGPANAIETLFIRNRYKLMQVGCNPIMIIVPPRCCETLNKCLEISASKWCSRLQNEVNAPEL